MRLAVHAPSLGLSRPEQLFGKDVANLALYQALARHADLDHICFLTADAAEDELLHQKLLPAARTKVGSSSLTDLRTPAEAGTLLRGQPYLAELAWARGQVESHRCWSLTGLIHTLAPPAVRALIGETLVAPVQPWDALVCTSESVRERVSTWLDEGQEHLFQRLGATRQPRPLLPLIPLGVNHEQLRDQAKDQQARHRLREHLQVGPDDLLVFWLGRLSFFEKAFPQPMFIALQRAVALSGCRLHFLMAGWFPGGDQDHRAYREAARQYAPQVPVHFLDGGNPEVVNSCWAAADIFLSLVDNPQETFGLAPVEAMAAGLPVVVSDWDGYRDTVQHGCEGYRIPSLALSRSTAGAQLALGHDFGLVSYQDYAGVVAQHTAIDIEAATQALIRLARNPEQRQRMGEEGQCTVKRRFNWSVIAGQYRQLFEHQAVLRCAVDNHSSQMVRPHPFRNDPFLSFAPFATQVLKESTTWTLTDNYRRLSQRLCHAPELDRVYSSARFDLDATQSLLAQLERHPGLSLKQLDHFWPLPKHEQLRFTLVWLAKLGYLEWHMPNQ